ncbi:MAG: Stp1/IreP family PP2C-type Ser/Thr phosphatase [Acidimicrobiia bacterium]|nr:Stp1/IreP family PP2C-type Ser/Thr phosphatase [Acidimicrobiia bacterium]
MTFTWATGSHRGRIRENNEDSVFPETSGRNDGPLVVAVADGMGGHVGGEVASRLAIDALATETNLPIAQRVSVANDRIMAEVADKAELRGMGTTLTAAELSAASLVIAHVGDSRAYLLRNGIFEQLTNDHSVVAEYLRAGSIRPEDVATHPQRSMLTRALGLYPNVEVDVIETRARNGDRVLICSDGLTSMVPDQRIAGVLGRSTPEEAVWTLIEMANQAGGNDNISVVVVDVGS